MLWVAATRDQVVEDNPECSWKDVSESEKAPFVAKAEKAKAKYEAARAKYVKSSDYAKHREELKDFKAKQAKKPFPRDVNAPKRAMSSYMFFVNEQRPYIVSEFPDMAATEVLRELGRRWGKLSTSQQAPYVVMQKEAKEEYQEELEAYKNTAKYKKYQKEKAEYQAKQKEAAKEAKRKASASTGRKAKKAMKPKKKRRSSSSRSGSRMSRSRSRSRSRSSSRRRSATPKSAKRRSRSATKRRAAKRRSAAVPKTPKKAKKGGRASSGSSASSKG